MSDCKTCGKTVRGTPDQVWYWGGDYCSDGCLKASKKRICLYCCNVLKGYQDQFCSRRCSAQHREARKKDLTSI